MVRLQREAAAAASALSTENQAASSAPVENESAAPVPAGNETPIPEAASSNEPAAAVAEQMETDETPGEESQEKPVMQDLSQTDSACKPEDTGTLKPSQVEVTAAVVVNDVAMQDAAAPSKNGGSSAAQVEGPPELKEAKSESDDKGVEMESDPADNQLAINDKNEEENAESQKPEVLQEKCAEPILSSTKEQSSAEPKTEDTANKMEEVVPQEQQHSTQDEAKLSNE